MRTVWAQATRPKLSSIPAPRACVKSIAARRATAANTSRNEIAACDLFALFLGPVLAVAAFADVSWKERKRKEWERRFAEINEQLEALRAREVEVWTRIQYHSVRHGILQHRRMYSTAAAVSVHDPQPALSGSLNLHLFDSTETEGTDTSWDRQSYRIRPEENSKAIAEESLGELPADSPLLRFEKLLALRLALQMLLHIYTGPDDLRARKIRGQRPEVTAEEIGKVVIRLQAVTDELDAADIRYSSVRYKKIFRHESPGSQSAETFWRTELHELGNLCRSRQIDIASLVDRLSQLLLTPGQRPPGPEFYARVTMLLSVNNFPELARYAILALQSTTYLLSNDDICLMLNHSSHTRNYAAYDWVIHNLTDKSGLLASESNRWKWVRLSGILLPVPRDQHPTLMRGLIRAALNFNDPKNAEAYAQVPWIRSGQTMGFAIKAFLQYYAKVADWHGGRKWLQEAQRWVGTRKDSNHPALRAVCVRIFDLLVAFRLDQQFNDLLAVVVEAGIDPPDVDSRTRESSERVWHIVESWREQINAKQVSPKQVTSFAVVKSTLQAVVESLPSAENSPLHLKESFPGARSINLVTPEVEEETNSAAQTSASDATDPLTDLAARPGNDTQTGDAATARSAASDITSGFGEIAMLDKVMELNESQREELRSMHVQQQEVITEQEQKLDDLKNTVAELKAFVEINIKARQTADAVQQEQAQQLREQKARIETLEEEARIWREQQELHATSSIAPPPYPDIDNVSEQLRYYLTHAFCDAHELTVPQIVAWAEAATKERCPKISKADAPTGHRRPMIYFIFKHVQSGRLSADVLRAEAEAAQARAERFRLEQESSRQARVDAAESPGANAIGSTTSGGSERPRDSASEATAGSLDRQPPSIKSPASSTASVSSRRAIRHPSQQQSRRYGSACRRQSRSQSSDYFGLLGTCDAHDSPELVRQASHFSASAASKRENSHVTKHESLNAADVKDPHKARQQYTLRRPVDLITTPPPDSEPSIATTPSSEVGSLNIRKTRSLWIRKPRIATIRILYRPTGPAISEPPSSSPTREANTSNLDPSESGLRIRNTYAPSASLIRSIRFDKKPQPRTTGDSQGLSDIRRVQSLRIRVKYPRAEDSKRFQARKHLRYVATEDNPGSPRASQGEVDALGAWDSSLRW
jgi:hypothetical protein